ncbi:fatty-acyl-CoA synthase [Caulobacter rhizosphaerae]|uniref:Fatty-acyl-CoA synthase n=1 Tax=Caulobacter rhizosphaerae TaxID=2010972 RepID=A0ABU1MVJ2_9CAUL|nr:long-chain-fatty-acid--CoA ligase [Caulobacter rhizosphaerae]MDR6530210.1 fatty-acyl-CoA synthase [Caulobacter rhizosphaerae]
MLGRMQHWPLTVDKILEHARTWHGAREVVTRSIDGPITRTTYADIDARARRLSTALLDWGIGPGDRVATLAWNTDRHMEAWYAIMGVGAVCHTLNPRLFAEQLIYIVNHAGDRIIFCDPTFVPLVKAIAPHCPSVERVVLLAGEGGELDLGPIAVERYEPVLASVTTPAPWGGFDENTACALCYTSGTTGDPKGVLYSHRSNFLHTLMGLQSTALGASPAEVILPIVPMFHANAWGIAFAAPAAGAKLVMPGARMDGAAIHELIEGEGVTFAAAVPTVWQGLLTHLRENALCLSTLKRVLIGGSAVPESLIRAFHDDFGVDVVQGWGMTETSPIGTLSNPPAALARAGLDAQMPWRLKQGTPPLGVELTLKDEAGRRLAHDGASPGRLMVRGPAVAAGYFGREDAVLDAEGWFDTGDIATIDPLGVMQITDRAKDMIKSGGEWISSIEVETIAAGHEDVALAAVIGVPHPRWDERPLLVVQLKPGAPQDHASHLAWLEGKIAKWWTPDQVVFVVQMPIGATGKVDKRRLRTLLSAGQLPEG